MHQTATFRLEITVSQTRSRDDQLTEAVNELIPAALEHRHGILVTQHDTATYTLEVHPSVPCGTIHEKRHPEP
ncbi:hypothetical protein AHiyo8_03580 [Arthrobacter sp. Hiyo8]|uniref:4-oxalocrotonate tautomerase n=1 Tax=Arthrobacter gyeryongensis TaxID=1650592 RepID=A0ABP9S1S3_9MICC|nr:hypothetical protein [Arthrobacter sp. Hiyo1]BAS12055.1 hypothetical protein AHiyo8_03580 [Arthrobacter sp. Hiyo8]GAP61232.1 hypothetical protein AHiyo1_49100 [Arthrobacter sp. Hiyo1]